jgi:hypothetical protein
MVDLFFAVNRILHIEYVVHDICAKAIREKHITGVDAI